MGKMSEKAALITGATGFLGRQVVQAFGRQGWTAKGIGFSRADGSKILKVDLGNTNDIETVLDDTKPRVVVHCAANKYAEKVDQDPEGARRLNVAAAGGLALSCAARSILLVYISTDYVFSGRPGEAPYAASSSTGPTNLYGQTKLEGELAVLAAYAVKRKEGLGVVLRVPVLYGPAHEPTESAVNVLMDVVSNKAQQPNAAKIKIDHWALRYPTNTEDVARVCHDIAVHYSSANDRAALPRVLQFSSEDKYTKYEMCQLFAEEIMGVSIDRIEANTEGNDPNASVQRPYDCHLSTRELKDIGIDVSTQDFLGWWRREMRSFRK